MPHAPSTARHCIGEHLGYLLTGTRTLLVAGSILSTAVLPGWLGLIGIPIGVAFLIGTSELRRDRDRLSEPYKRRPASRRCLLHAAWTARPLATSVRPPLIQGRMWS